MGLDRVQEVAARAVRARGLELTWKAVADDSEKVNEAFENHLESYLTKGALEEITARYGDLVAARVKAVYDDALDAPVDWRTATLDTALDVMHELLDRKYPWLSRKARTKINHAFVMSWK